MTIQRLTPVLASVAKKAKPDSDESRILGGKQQLLPQLVAAQAQDSDCWLQ
jgi:hypothetical protein